MLLPVPTCLAAATALPADSPVSVTAPAPLSTWAMLRLLSLAADHSAYVMPTSVALTAPATPAVFSLPSPLPVHFLAGSAVQTLGAAPLRYLVKFSVVPDSSLRKNTLIAVLGSVTPGLTLAIAGSLQVVIWPRKILAMTSGVRISLSTPLSL